jgi:hypothetical protein
MHKSCIQPVVAQISTSDHNDLVRNYDTVDCACFPPTQRQSRQHPNRANARFPAQPLLLFDLQGYITVLGEAGLSLQTTVTNQCACFTMEAQVDMRVTTNEMYIYEYPTAYP